MSHFEQAMSLATLSRIRLLILYISERPRMLTRITCHVFIKVFSLRPVSPYLFHAAKIKLACDFGAPVIVNYAWSSL